MNGKLKPLLEEVRNYLTALYGVRLSRIVLFGSQARGDAETGSDIDLLIVLKGSVRTGEEVNRTKEFLTDSCLRYNLLINFYFMDEERFSRRNGPLLRNIRREGIAL